MCKGIFLAVLAVGVALALVLVGLAAFGYSPLTVAREWILSPLSTRRDIAASLTYACPLLLTGLATGIAFRSGVLNIGAEGQALLGAMAAAAVATRWLPNGSPVLVICIALSTGVVAGGLWALIAALLDRYRGVPIVLSTILLNFVAFYVLHALITGPLQATGTKAAQSDRIADSFQLPIVLARTSLHAGVIMAFVVAAVAWLVQSRTSFGFELLVTGLNPTTARLAGIPVLRRQVGVMLISGGFAGLAGAVQLLGKTHVLHPDFTAYGYAGIAVAMLGRLHPIGIVAAALFFGALDNGAYALEENPDLNITHSVSDVIKGVVVLAMLVGTAYLLRKRSTARQAL